MTYNVSRVKPYSLTHYVGDSVVVDEQKFKKRVVISVPKLVQTMKQ